MTEKTCPRCKRTLPVGADHWYPRRQVRVKKCPAFLDPAAGVRCPWTATYDYILPSGYCRECQNKVTTQGQKVRRHLDWMPIPESDKIMALLPQPCACCGRKTRNAPRLVPGIHPVPEPIRVCLQCKGRLDAIKFSLTEAKTHLLLWREHLNEEAAAEAAHKSNRARRPHAGLPRNVVTMQGSHAWCVTEEATWRTITAFLARLSALHPMQPRPKTWGGVRVPYPS